MAIICLKLLGCVNFFIKYSLQVKKILFLKLTVILLLCRYDLRERKLVNSVNQC